MHIIHATAYMLRLLYWPRCAVILLNNIVQILMHETIIASFCKQSATLESVCMAQPASCVARMDR